MTHRRKPSRQFALALAAAWLVAAAAPEPTTPADQLAYAKKLYAENKRDEAHAWAQKAADQGLAEAWFWIGYTSTGDTTSYYKKAAEGGYAEAFGYLFDDLLFRAGDKADVAEAKRFADLARKQHVSVYDSDNVFRTIDRCFEAGVPHVPQPRDDDHALAEAYANGEGVKRSAKTAIALLCHSSDVPAELEGMVDALYETKDDPTLDEPFRFCDHVTSGMSQGRCAADEESGRSEKRGAELAAVTKDWKGPQKAAFEELRKAADAFFEERSSSEVDQSGTARAALSIGERAELEDGFLAALRDYARGSYPSDRDFDKADRALNDTYRKLMEPGALGDWGTVKADGVRKTQRLWIRYRDAWVAFAAARYPKLSATAVKTWLTKQRAVQLQALFGD